MSSWERSKKMLVKIIIAILASSAVFTFAQFLITRHDTKKNMDGKLKSLEKDGLRTQLLLLILMCPKEQKEIMTIAEHYFSKPPKGLDGDWYMTSIFNKWLLNSDIAAPEWFESKT